MKVAIVIYGKTIEGGGGAERRFIRVFEKLKNEKDNQILLIVNRMLFDSFYKLDLLSHSDNIIIIDDSSFLRDVNFNYQLIKLLFFDNKFDTIHLVLVQKSLIPFYLFLGVYGNKKLKVVSTVANYRLAYKKRLAFFDSVVYYLYRKVSNHIDSLYPKIISPNKSFSITPCPFTDYTTFKPKKKENIVLFAGRLHHFKNPMVFTKAVVLMLENYKLEVLKKWYFIICGSGPLETEIKNYIQNKGFEDRFYIGKCNNMADLMGKSKVFVSLQTDENYPSQSLIEAIVTQNNIIVTDVGDTRLLFKNGIANFINLDSHELSKTLLEIIINGGYSRSVLEDASKKFIDKNNIDTFKDYLLNIWNDEGDYNNFVSSTLKKN